jgi:hypothetical protein
VPVQGGDLKQDLVFTPSTVGKFEFEFQSAAADEITVTENAGAAAAAPPAGFEAIEPNSYTVALGVSKGAGLTLSKIDYIFDAAAAGLAGKDVKQAQVGKLCAETGSFVISALLGELEFELEENEVTLNLNKNVTAEGQWGKSISPTPKHLDLLTNSKVSSFPSPPLVLVLVLVPLSKRRPLKTLLQRKRLPRTKPLRTKPPRTLPQRRRPLPKRRRRRKKRPPRTLQQRRRRLLTQLRCTSRLRLLRRRHKRRPQQLRARCKKRLRLPRARCRKRLPCRLLNKRTRRLRCFWRPRRRSRALVRRKLWRLMTRS